jgi:dihydroxyacid dehydratase/phosphogluconate dehydratase
LILHLPAIAFSAGLKRPGVEDWAQVNRQTPRLVDAMPNGPRMHPTIQVFLAGGVPEAMLHLRRAGLLETGARTVTGEKLDTLLDWWEQSERRAALRRLLRERDGVDPDDVIMSPDRARQRGLTSTVTFPVGNLAPGGAVIKSTAIDPSVVDADGVYRKRGPARIFRTEPDSARRRAGADVPRAARLRHGRDLRNHGGAALPRFRQARGGDHRCALQRRIHRRVHRARDAGSAGGRSDRQAARGRPD